MQLLNPGNQKQNSDCHVEASKCKIKKTVGATVMSLVLFHTVYTLH